MKISMLIIKEASVTSISETGKKEGRLVMLAQFDFIDTFIMNLNFK